MAVLVTVASKHGATRGVGEVISQGLARHGFETTVLSPDEVFDLEGYEAVVLGSTVYAGHWLKPATEFVDRFVGSLADRPVWLFSSGPVGNPLKPDDEPVDVPEIVRRTGAHEHRVFAGRIGKNRMSLPERTVVRALRVADGDYRDWAAVDNWAAEIAAALGGR